MSAALLVENGLLESAPSQELAVLISIRGISGAIDDINSQEDLIR